MGTARRSRRRDRRRTAPAVRQGRSPPSSLFREWPPQMAAGLRGPRRGTVAPLGSRLPAELSAIPPSPRPPIQQPGDRRAGRRSGWHGGFQRGRDRGAPVRPPGRCAGRRARPSATDEAFTVLRGRVGFSVAGKRQIAPLGQRLHVAPGVAHDWLASQVESPGERPRHASTGQADCTRPRCATGQRGAGWLAERNSSTARLNAAGCSRLG